jgi:hypothetical protein
MQEFLYLGISALELVLFRNTAPRPRSSTMISEWSVFHVAVLTNLINALVYILAAVAAKALVYTDPGPEPHGPAQKTQRSLYVGLAEVYPAVKTSFP